MIDYLTPHWDRSALVVIDLQKDFLDDGAAPIPGTSNIVDSVAALAGAFREAGRPIGHIVRLYQPGGSDVDLPRRHVVEQGAELVAPGSVGSQIPERVVPAGGQLDSDALLAGVAQQIGHRELIFFKPRWSAFYRTGLEGWLREQDCDTVVVVGCNLPNCPRATLFDASERDFRTVIISDAVSQVTDERLADLRGIGVQVVSLDVAVEALAAAAAPSGEDMASD